MRWMLSAGGGRGMKDYISLKMAAFNDSSDYPGDLSYLENG